MDGIPIKAAHTIPNKKDDIPSRRSLGMWDSGMRAEVAQHSQIMKESSAFGARQGTKRPLKDEARKYKKTPEERYNKITKKSFYKSLQLTDPSEIALVKTYFIKGAKQGKTNGEAFLYAKSALEYERAGEKVRKKARADKKTAQEAKRQADEAKRQADQKKAQEAKRQAQEAKRQAQEDKRKAAVNLFEDNKKLVNTLKDFKDKENPTHDDKWILKNLPNRKLNTPETTKYLNNLIKLLNSNPERYSIKAQRAAAAQQKKDTDFRTINKKLPQYYKDYFSGDNKFLNDVIKKHLKFKTKFNENVANSEEFIFTETSKAINISADKLQELFYNDGIAVIVKLLIDDGIKQLQANESLTKHYMYTFYAPKLTNLILRAFKMKNHNQNYTKLYFTPKQTLKKLPPRKRSTSHLLKINLVNKSVDLTKLRELGDVKQPAKASKASRSTVAKVRSAKTDKDKLVERIKLLNKIPDKNKSVEQLTKDLQDTKSLLQSGRNWVEDAISTKEQIALLGHSNADVKHPYYLVNALASYYSYSSKRPAQLLGTWKYQSNVSAQNMAVYKDESRKQIVVAIKGTTSLQEVVADVFEVLFELTDVITSVPEKITNRTIKPILVTLKKRLDKVILQNPSYQIQLTGHSWGAYAALYLNRWREIQHIQENGTKYEDTTGKIRFKPNKSKPYKPMSITTFNAGSGLSSLSQSFQNFFKSYKPSPTRKITLRNYRIEGDIVSVLQSSYPTAYSYQKQFKKKCKSYTAHMMANFLHDVFLNPKDRCVK